MKKDTIEYLTKNSLFFNKVVEINGPKIASICAHAYEMN